MSTGSQTVKKQHTEPAHAFSFLSDMLTDKQLGLHSVVSGTVRLAVYVYT